MEKNDKQVRQCVVCGMALLSKIGRGRPALLCPAHKAERIAEQKRRYYQDNMERIAERQRRYRQDNRERIAEQQRRYYQDNRERIAEQQRRYYQDNGMNDVYAVEAELGIRRTTNRCQVCGIKITANSKYITYCSYECYRAAFQGYTQRGRRNE